MLISINSPRKVYASKIAPDKSMMIIFEPQYTYYQKTITIFMNTNYPDKTCAIDRLIRHPKLISAALDGAKTQQRRDGLYAYPHETFELEGIAFTVTSVERQRLGDMTDADAIAEGYPSLEVYKNIILQMHANMAWNEESQVWVHSFKRID